MLNYITTLEELEKDFKKRVVIDNQAIMVTLLANKVYAIQDKCTHLGASLSKGVHDDDHVKCRAHGAIFNVKSGDVIEKAHVGFIKMPTKKLKTFKTEVNEGKVYIDI